MAPSRRSASSRRILSGNTRRPADSPRRRVTRSEEPFSGLLLPLAASPAPAIRGASQAGVSTAHWLLAWTGLGPRGGISVGLGPRSQGQGLSTGSRPARHKQEAEQLGGGELGLARWAERWG